MQPGPLPSVYQLRVVVRGVSPLIWRRLLIAADTTIADLHAVSQIASGWNRDHLHRFVVQGREYGTGYVGGPSFGDGPRVVRLGDLGLRRTERFTYHYDFTHTWRWAEQITQAWHPHRRGPDRRPAAHPAGRGRCRPDRRTLQQTDQPNSRYGV